ncbi:alanine--tRNA ligase, cytoplasmic-like isoform X2 [Dreissena polymorpha]|uniref:Alanine--tRNA ligase n=1 Tax=Dreissena polymorpha TaxID=45954 RepID=A0A9D4DN89_DREPO|nr:alanine--tRNA ligase, cytoplasmic-like isoform X2 [Dreissena polymorpha]KAH3752173.1 hypothetical protein DPMN_186785 [Dreissena polymorpha]
MSLLRQKLLEPRIKKIILQKIVKRYKHECQSKAVRSMFIDYFCNSHGHKFVKSSSVIPDANDGTYFSNAGMNQFKPIFLGTAPITSELAGYQRVANSQKCVRVGGKHNDLDDVGYDLTHHTFFEMLGSWSFGDYFKDEACAMALHLLLDVYKLRKDCLYFSYFKGDTDLALKPDLQTAEIWRQLGIPADHILPFGMRDNFWEMGETGPCGPCTEIHYDHTMAGNCAHLVNTGSPCVIEIWNLVFMQFNRLSSTQLVPLPSCHVDTGMGLERLCAVLQGTRSNYNTDLFWPIFNAMHKETGLPQYGDKTGTDDTGGVDTGYRILADHTRMAAVCIADGLLPGRQGLESRVRFVIDRALHQCHHVLNIRPGLMGKLVQPVVETLGEAYPELSLHENKIRDVLCEAEERYLELYEDGKYNFTKLLRKMPDIKTLDEEQILRLRDGWYGRPMSTHLIELIAGQYGLSVDRDIIHSLNTQPASDIEDEEFPCFTAELLNDLSITKVPPTDDSLKYVYIDKKCPDIESSISCLVDENNTLVDTVKSGVHVGVITRLTNFYAEKGGQAADVGVIRSKTGRVRVTDVQSIHDLVLHTGVVEEGTMETGQMVTMEIDQTHRQGCMYNHTATHLLNAALRHILGPDVSQRGSSVLPDKLSFEFSCVSKITAAEVKVIDTLLSGWVRGSHCLSVERKLAPLAEALQMEGIIYLDNVVYPEVVSVVSVVDDISKECISRELCGGTHAHTLAELGEICITSVTGQATGVKSVVCLTGLPAVQARKQAAVATEMCNGLEMALKVQQGQPIDLEHCLQLHKEVNHILGTEVLPKTDKDALKERMDKAGTILNTHVNNEAFANLEEELDRRMANGEESFIVAQFEVKVLPKVNKLMKRLDIRKPLILLVKATNNTNAYIAMPKSSPLPLNDFVGEFCTDVQGKVTQQETNYTVVSARGDQSERFLKAANVLQLRYGRKEFVI